MQQFDQAPIMKNLHDGIAIVIDGNKAKVAADKGQYILLKNSTITGKEDGGYTAAKDIPADTVLDDTYLSTKLSEGIANSLNDQITNKIKYTDSVLFTLSSATAPTKTINATSGHRSIMFICDSNSSRCGIYTLATTSANIFQNTAILAASGVTFDVSQTGKLTLTVSSGGCNVFVMCLAGTISIT